MLSNNDRKVAYCLVRIIIVIFLSLVRRKLTKQVSPHVYKLDVCDRGTCKFITSTGIASKDTTINCGKIVGSTRVDSFPLTTKV